MSFLKKIFKKKAGGTGVGNLLRGISSTVTMGALGTGLNKIELGQTKTNKELATFAGQPAEVKNDTYYMSTSLPEVTVTAPASVTDFRESNVLAPVNNFRQKGDNSIMSKFGEALKPLIEKATEGATVGADNRTLLIVGLGAFGIIAAILYNRR